MTTKQAYSLTNGLDLVAVECDATDMINYGYVPHLVDKTLRSYSVWIYPTSATGGGIFGFIDGNDIGERFEFSGAARKINYLKSIVKVGGSIGANGWSTDSVLSLNGWHNIVITHDTSSDPTADPLIYLDGTLSALTQYSTNAGTVPSMTGLPLQIGNLKSPSIDYSQPFYGKILAPRIYDDILSQAEVTALYAAGRDDISTLTGNLIFQGLCVRTKDLAYYTDHTMVSSDGVIDNIHGIVGKPNSTPVTRLP
jgi:hypothetical protein